jgi:hypothetical protein
MIKVKYVDSILNKKEFDIVNVNTRDITFKFYNKFIVKPMLDKMPVSIMGKK